MPVKIRLSRQGRKARPFYHIVAADSRSPRDGKFIERLGSFNPMTHPATIELDFDRALYWLQSGAQPTDTARSILSTEGVLLKKHLLEGVKKGALTVEQVESKFEAWKTNKVSEIQGVKEGDAKKKAAAKKAQLDAEAKVKEARAEAIAKKLAEAQAPAAAEESAENTEAPVAE
jgi:small subunit ribosomal protein S16